MDRSQIENCSEMYLREIALKQYDLLQSFSKARPLWLPKYGMIDDPETEALARLSQRLDELTDRKDNT